LFYGGRGTGFAGAADDAVAAGEEVFGGGVADARGTAGYYDGFHRGLSLARGWGGGGEELGWCEREHTPAAKAGFVAGL